MFEALTVLLVDDDASIQTTLYRALEDEGCSVLAAGNGAEALDICRQSRRPIDLMLTDIEMPGMSGFDLASRALTLQPLMKILFMSGHAGHAAAHAAAVLDLRTFLAKPFGRASLVRGLRLAMGC